MMAFTFRNFGKSKELTDAEERSKQYGADYAESSNVSGLRDQWQSAKANKPSDWTGGKWGEQVNNALNDIINRKPFSYDLNGDMLYQQYKDQYINQGKQAMMDTMGQAAALTGGYGNSYAQTVGQQTYQGYLQGLNDKVPELYQLALSKYNQEGNDLSNKYSMLQNLYNSDYGEYRDRVSDWQSAVDAAYNIYNNERANEQNQYNANRQYAYDVANSMYSKEYGEYSDAYNRAFGEHQQAESERQFNANLSLQQEANKIAAAKAAQAAADSTKKKNNIEAKETPRAKKFTNTLIAKKWWGTGMTSSDEKKYGSYEDYVSAKILDAVDNDELNESEAKYLLEEVYNVK